MTEEDGGSQLIPYGPESAPFPTKSALAFAPPFPDRGFAYAPIGREVLSHFGSDSFKCQPVKACHDERLKFGIPCDLGRRAGSVFAAVFADRRGGLWQGVHALLKADFNGGFKSRDRAALCGVAGA